MDPILMFQNLLGIGYNLRSFILIVLSWYTGIDAVVRRAVTDTDKSTSQAGNNDYGNSNDQNSNDHWRRMLATNTQICYNSQDLEDSWATEGIKYFLPFVCIIVLWVLVFLWQSGAFRYRINQLGFHVRWINARKTVWYKCCAFAVAIVLVLTAIAGISSDPELAGPILSMVFTVLIALVDLYSPLEETIDFKGDILNTQIKGFFWAMTDSSKIVEIFQDAALSAHANDFSHLQALTAADKEGANSILSNIGSLPKPEAHMCEMFCCPADKKDMTAVSPRGDIELQFGDRPLPATPAVS